MLRLKVHVGIMLAGLFVSTLAMQNENSQNAMQNAERLRTLEDEQGSERAISLPVAPAEPDLEQPKSNTIDPRILDFEPEESPDNRCCRLPRGKAKCLCVCATVAIASAVAIEYFTSDKSFLEVIGGGISQPPTRSPPLLEQLLMDSSTPLSGEQSRKVVAPVVTGQVAA